MKNSMKKVGQILALPLVVGGLVLLGWFLLKGVRIDLLQPRGEVGKQELQLLIFTLALSALVVIPVFVMLGLFAYRYRETNTKAAYRPEWDKNSWLEALWWGIPITIICILAVVTWRTSHSLDPYMRLDNGAKPINVQVVALEWKWLFIYPDQKIATVNQLPVPVGQPIHFTLTADAPMSAFWIPALGTQIYNMNGMSTQLNLRADELGDMKGYTSNINGPGYSRMVFTVHSLSSRHFDEWVKKAQASPDTMNSMMYRKLAVPSTIDGERTYRLTEPDLYNTVLAKYMGMGGHGHAGHEDSMSTMDMSGGSM